MNRYFPGDEVRLLASFRTLALGASNPATVVFEVQPPSGPVQTPSVVNDDVGQYHADVQIPTGSASVGTWTYRVESTGNPTRALEGAFVVLASGFLS